MTTFNLMSMTGFGRAQGDTPFGQFVVELRTVNNRFQDISVSLPRELGLLESSLRNLLKQEITRGKIDCRVRYTAPESALPRVTINLALAKAYITQLKQLQEAGAAGEIPLQTLTQLPGVMEIGTSELDEQAIWQALQDVARQAIESLGQERAREGEALGQQLSGLIQQLTGYVEQIDRASGEVVQRYREKLTARIAELEAGIKTQLEPGRLEMEVALFADRSDVSEEMVRLRAHLTRFESLIENKEGIPTGKNLDFLVQELGREINTTGAKVRDTSVVGHTLEMKSLLERIREQVQNIQ